MYAPASCSVSIRRPRIQPSLVTASAISMCQGARVDEARNSSSRVQRHLTGPLRLERQERADRLGRRVDLAAEAAADGAADELELVQRALEVRGDDAHREVHRLRAGVDRQPPVRLRHDERDLRLERAVLDRLRPVDALDDHVGLRRTPTRRRPCGSAGGRAARSGGRPAPTGGSAATRDRTPCACRRAARAPRSRPRSASSASSAVSSSRRRRRRSAGPCSGPRPSASSGSSPGTPSPSRWPWTFFGTSVLRDDRVHARDALGLARVELRIPAWCGDRSAFVQSMPGTRTSSTYVVRPVTCASPS